MKYLLLLVALILSGGATAECIIDNVTINLCDTILGPDGEDANVHLSWTKPTHREPFNGGTGEILSPSEIGGYLLFKNTSGDDSNPVYDQIHDVTNGTHEDVFMFFAAGNHTVVLVTYDQQVRTSKDSSQVKLSLEGVTLPPNNASGFTMRVIGTKFISIP